MSGYSVTVGGIEMSRKLRKMKRNRSCVEKMKPSLILTVNTIKEDNFKVNKLSIWSCLQYEYVDGFQA